jgi:hypothetical protein
MHEIPGGAGEAAGADVRSGAGVWLRVGDIGDGLLLSALGQFYVRAIDLAGGRSITGAAAAIHRVLLCFVRHWGARRRSDRSAPLLSIIGLVLPCDRSQYLLLCGLHDPSQLFRGLH